MTGKDVQIQLRLGHRNLSRLERSMLVDGFVNALGLVVGGFRGKDGVQTDSVSEPAILKVRVPSHHENSLIVEQVLRLAKNCGAEVHGPVNITPIDDTPPDPSGYFS